MYNDKQASQYPLTQSDKVPEPVEPIDTAGPSRLKVLLTVSFHISIALSVTLLNKWALNTVPLPQVLLAFQTGICVILSIVVKAFGWGSVGTLNLPLSEVKRLWVYLIMRTVAVGMKVWCLNLVPASFYQVSRGLLLPITVLLSFLFLGSRASPGILVNIVIICIGFVIGSAAKLTESKSSMGIFDLGFVLGILSTFTTAAETIVVKIYAPKLPIFRAVYTTSLVGFIAFTALSYASGGFDDFSRLVDTARMASITGVGGPTFAQVVSAILVSGVAYYLVSLAAVLQITVTTPVTHTISTAVRGVLQSLLAVVLLPNESLSLSAIVSIFFILFGSARYTLHKEREKKDKEAAARAGGGKLAALLPRRLGHQWRIQTPSITPHHAVEPEGVYEPEVEERVVEPVKQVPVAPPAPVEPVKPKQKHPAEPVKGKHPVPASVPVTKRRAPWIEPPPTSEEMPPVLVTGPASDDSPFTKHRHTLPYEGTLYHLSSSVHPPKHMRKSAYRFTSLWYVEQDEYFDWVGKMVQARLPPVADFIAFTCEWSLPEEGLFEVVQGEAVMQGRHEYVLSECPMPSWAADKLNTKRSKADREAGLDMIRRGDVTVKAWADLGDVTKEKTEGPPAKDPHLLWLKDAHKLDLTHAVTEAQDDGSVHMFMINKTIASAGWTEPADHHKLSVCVSPVRLQPKAKDDVTRLKDYVEWRVWHMYQGVGIVHWYARDPKFGRWVERLNEMLGINDTYLTTPVLSDLTPEKGRSYADQAVWIEDCLIRYQYSDEWQAHIDLDEYMYPRYDTRPYGTIHRLDRLDDNVASFAADHTYFGGKRLEGEDVPKVEAFGHFPRNAWTHWDTLAKHDGFRRQKSMHRTAGSTMLWVHGAAGMGNGYRRVQDDPGPVEDETALVGEDGQVQSNMEILHDRRPMPQALTFENELESDISTRWAGVWQKMSKVLADKELEVLYDPERLWGGRGGVAASLAASLAALLRV